MNDSEIFLDSFFVARQPVFHTDWAIWGYELLFRNSEDSRFADIGDEDAATSQVIADGFGLIQEDIIEGQRLLVNFPRNMLLEEAAAGMLPPEVCVVEILEHVQPEPDVLEALKQLKKSGYTLALDDYVGQKGFEPFIELADIIKVECLGMGRDKLTQITNKLSKYDVTLLAEKVEDSDMFNFCKGLGFELFQGFFFSRPEIIPGKKMSTNNMNRMQLLKSVSGDNFDVDDLTRTINSDVSISYRLLRFMNSPTFGLPNTINSIQQAIVLLGYKKLAGWLRVILLSDMCSGPAGNELAFLSIKRAKFLELMAADNNCGFLSAESMFLLGLFSLLDVLMGRPMEELLAELPIEDELVKALTGEDGCASLWLDLVRAFEKADWTGLGTLIAENNLSALSIARNHLAAMQWANEVALLNKQE
ncbi:EAL and HDOD domain-containing protein [Maridesulfovibrio hydrothermalis]|uniref:Diguanylate phosphodiesterase n=1 Tax=Maridesulfovibrio hydrothermalis AM13 = DSM 14728 TaxID=1121451 RepID=L0RGV3_9BACT|nr:HDOD domain-containing protein [Maridesulfovibrio hydrothermalis]CCO25430.1 Diguanylate phosphodiesterase [Maridesulfovibrio hydrothermalis AM13 = DSM 14728]